ncbi:Tryptophan-rich sensory protein [Burkholderiales bacterium 8X]|nr:Tryptophan-rich sensory protein [Burkholderiales bacterium 8X]
MSSGAARRLRPVLVAVLCALGVALLGGLMTDIGPWYRGLAQPAWKPPDWLFGPAWTLIYGLTAAAGVLAWRRTPKGAPRDGALALFAMNAFLNVFWSLLYFRLRRPDWALFEVVFLWLSVLALMVALYRHSRTATWLLLPYLAWVTFAGLLNLATVRLNGPFGAG